MISAILLLAVVELLSAFPLNERQDQCSNIPPVPDRCEDARLNYTQEVQRIFRSLTPATINHAVRVLELYLDEYCAPDCLGPITTVLNCSNETRSANIYENGACIRDGGTYCFIKILQVNASGTALIPTCALDRTCSYSSSCKQTIRTLQEQTGCCLASYYNTPGSVFGSLAHLFTHYCSVSLGNPCPGDSQS